MLLRRVEEHPSRAIAFMIHAVQISLLTLDAAVNPGIHFGWHNAVAGVELLFSLLLVVYHVIRIRVVWRTPFTTLPTSLPGCCVVGRPESLDQDRPSLDYLQRRALWGLGVSLLLQVSLVVVAAASLAEERRPLEWAAFVLAVLWAVGTHTVTDARVRTYDIHRTQDRDPSSNQPSSWTMVDVLRSAVRQHLWPPREGVALLTIVILAVLHAALTAFQGVATTWLMQDGIGYYAIRRAALNSESSVMDVYESDLCQWTGCSDESLALSAFRVLAAWFAAQVVGALLDGLSAAVILRWEVRVRDWIVVRATDPTCPPHQRWSSSRVYETDVAGASELQFAALGLLVQTLTTVSCWSVLTAMDWGVAALCLALLPMLSTASGYTLTSPVLRHPPSEDSHTRTIRKAAVLLQWSLTPASDLADGESGASSGGAPPPSSSGAVSPESLIELHRRDLLQPQRESWLRRVVYSDAAVEVFVHWYTSMIGVAVLIRLAFDVADGRIPATSGVAVVWLSGRVLGSVASLPDLVRRIASLAHTLSSIESLVHGNGNDDDVDDATPSGPTARALVPWIPTAESSVVSLSALLDLTTTDSSLNGDDDIDHDESRADYDNDDHDDDELTSNDRDGTCSV